MLRDKLLESLGLLMEALQPEQLTDCMNRDQIYNCYSDMRTHTVGWDDAALLAEYSQLVAEMLRLAREERRVKIVD